jgi:hypothetical protein
MIDFYSIARFLNARYQVKKEGVVLDFSERVKLVEEAALTFVIIDMKEDIEGNEQRHAYLNGIILGIAISACSNEVDFKKLIDLMEASREKQELDQWKVEELKNVK